MAIYKAAIKKEIDRKKQTPQIGSAVVEGLSTSLNGDTIKLSNYKRKYVLLDFWAGWCTPCRAKNPQLKELYSKYKPEGFEVIGISNDRNVDNWKNAIKTINILGYK